MPCGEPCSRQLATAKDDAEEVEAELLQVTRGDEGGVRSDVGARRGEDVVQKKWRFIFGEYHGPVPYETEHSWPIQGDRDVERCFWARLDRVLFQHDNDWLSHAQRTVLLNFCRTAGLCR